MFNFSVLTILTKFSKYCVQVTLSLKMGYINTDFLQFPSSAELAERIVSLNSDNVFDIFTTTYHCYSFKKPSSYKILLVCSIFSCSYT